MFKPLSLLLTICLYSFLTFPVHSIIQYLLFLFGLLPLRLLQAKFIRVPENGRISVFFLGQYYSVLCVWFFAFVSPLLYLLFCGSCVLMLSHCFLQEDHSWMFYSNSSFLLHFSLFFQQIMINKKKDDFLSQNEEASVRYCQAELKKLSEPLMTSISEGTFFVPGGHHCYLEARNKFEENYKLIPRKGVKVRSKGTGKEQQI